jgi:RNA polymerase sigma factor (sigma-70 family)
MSGNQLSQVLRRIHDLAGPSATADTTDADLLRRFVAGRDEAAFAAVLERHGPLVLGVCRRVLDDAHDAEDAFQATFLVLARRAVSIRQSASLASWLYGVAYRVSLEAKTRAARRRFHEYQAAAARPPCTAPAGNADEDLRPVLNEELRHLPEKYRAPLVLHYLEGKTKQEAARQLGWTEGTVSGRLDRARKLLRRRLLRRGVSLSVGAIAALLATPASRATVPAILREATRRAALSFGSASTPSVAGSLAEAVLRGVFVGRLKLGAALFLLVGALASGMGLAARYLPASAPAEQGRPAPLVARKAEEPPPPLPKPEERKEPGSHDVAVAKLEAMSPERWEESWKSDLDVTDEPAGPVLRRLARELGLSIEATAAQERDLERTIRLKVRGRSRLEMVEEVCRCVGLYPVYSHDVASHGEYGKTIRLRKGPRPSPVTFAGPFRVTVEGVETKPASGSGELPIRFLALGLPPAVALPLKHEQPIRVEQVAGPGGQALLNPDKKPSWTGTDTYTGFDQTQYLKLKDLGRDGAVLRTLAGTFRVPIASRVDSARLAPLKTGTGKSIGDMQVTLEKISTRREVIDGDEPQERRDYDVYFRGIDLFRLELIGHDAHGRLLRTVFHQGWGGAENEGHKVIGFTRPPTSITAKALAELKFREYPFRLENVPLSAPAGKRQ